MLLREADRRLGLSAALDAVLPDPRHPDYITHPQVNLLRQRIYGLAMGDEDLNDHETLRHDLVWQTALGRTESLAGDSTLCRLEHRVDRQAALAFHQVHFDQFVASFAEPPTELILDFDATDDRVHGQQEGRHFHGSYGNYCFLPLYGFCGEQLLVAYLRPSNIDGARHAWAILKLLTTALREKWPAVRIILRGGLSGRRAKESGLAETLQCREESTVLRGPLRSEFLSSRARRPPARFFPLDGGLTGRLHAHGSIERNPALSGIGGAP